MSIEKLSTPWPEWKVVEQLGEGSFGTVYKIIREEHGVASTAAMKVIPIPQNDAELSSIRSEGLDETGTRSYFEGIVTDFVNEIKMMETMKGTSNIVSVEDYKVMERKSKIGWLIFIRMELLTPLNDYTADKELTEAEVIKLGQDICSALELCAQRSIMHRDIKPENIFISSFGDFKVGDFGIARKLEKTSDSLSRKGTPNYMAPEIDATNDYDGTVDIYSLGLVLYKLMNNNRLPFIDPNAQLIQYQDRKAAIERRFGGEALPAPINASPHLAQVILAACAFKPSERFQTPTAFKNALGAIKGEKPSKTPARSVAATDLNATTAARRAPEATQPTTQADVPVASFGKEKKKSKVKRFFIAVLVLIIIGGLAVGAYIINPSGVFDGVHDVVGAIVGDPVADVITALEEGNYEDALSLAAEADNDALRIGLEKRLDILAADFKDENAEYAAVIMELDTISKMNVPGLSETLNTTRNFVNALNTSRTAFNTAEALFSQGNYVEAIEQYRLVISDDPNYPKALEGLNNAVNAYRSSVIKEANGYADQGNYDEAIRVLNSGLSVLENDAELTQTLTLMEQRYVTSIIAQADKLAAEGNYVEAIRVINNAWRISENNTELAQSLSRIQQMYVTATISEADKLVADGKYDDAIALINEVLQTVPGDEKLISKRDEIESAKPVGLSTVVVIDSSRYYYSDDIFTDSFGNRYRDSLCFKPQAGSYETFSDTREFSYAVYNLNKNFARFSAEIVAPEGLRSSADFLVEVSFEGNPAPVASHEGLNVRTGVRSLEVDVSGVTTMTITVRVKSSGSYWGNEHSIHLVNAELSK